MSAVKVPHARAFIPSSYVLCFDKNFPVFVNRMGKLRRNEPDPAGGEYTPHGNCRSDDRQLLGCHRTRQSTSEHPAKHDNKADNRRCDTPVTDALGHTQP